MTNYCCINLILWTRNLFWILNDKIKKKKIKCQLFAVYKGMFKKVLRITNKCILYREKIDRIL